MWELEDAINYYRTKAEEMYRNSRLFLKAGNKTGAVRDQIIADEYNLTAQWLNELKAFREARIEIAQLPLVWEEGEGIRKCINIIDSQVNLAKEEYECNI